MRRFAARILLLSVSMVVALLLAEGAVRTYLLANRRLADRLKEFDILSVNIVPQGDNGFAQRPNSTFHFPNGKVATSNDQGFRGPDVAVPKPPGAFRVLLFGGSTTHGWGVRNDETIDHYMRAAFADHFPEIRVEIVNLAFDGYDSYQAFERLRYQGLALDPDLIIVNTGINDVGNARFLDLQDRDPRTMLWLSVTETLREIEARGRPSVRSVLKHYSYLVRLISLVRTERVQRRELQERRDREVRSDSGLPEVPNYAAADYFERNLYRIADVAAQHNIPILFSVPPSALRSAKYRPDSRSRQAYWITNARVTQTVRDTLEQRMRKVVTTLRERGQPVQFVPHDVEDPKFFLDDCHLTPAGNRRVAADFEAAVAGWLERPAIGATEGSGS